MKEKLTYWGKEVTEFYSMVIEGKYVKARRTTKYHEDNKQKGISEIKWEIDDVPMNIKIHKIINKEKLK